MKRFIFLCAVKIEILNNLEWILTNMSDEFLCDIYTYGPGDFTKNEERSADLRVFAKTWRWAKIITHKIDCSFYRINNDTEHYILFEIGNDEMYVVDAFPSFCQFFSLPKPRPTWFIDLGDGIISYFSQTISDRIEDEYEELGMVGEGEIYLDVGGFLASSIAVDFNDMTCRISNTEYTIGRFC